MQTCYRHSDRETGVSCSACGRPICPDCMTSTSVGMRCPECASQTTKVRGMGSLHRDPVLTYGLIAANVVIGLALTLGSGTAAVADINGYGVLFRPSVGAGEWWRLVTSGFLHGSESGRSVVMHLLFNMLALYVLGTMLEPVIGRLRFALIYFSSLLAGSLGALLLSPLSFTRGASGAVFGLMGAGLLFMRQRGISPMESGLGLWIGINLLITFTIPGISIGGHIGGLVGGLICGYAFFELSERRDVPARAPIIIAAGVGVVSAALAIVIANAAPV